MNIMKNPKLIHPFNLSSVFEFPKPSVIVLRDKNIFKSLEDLVCFAENERVFVWYFETDMDDFWDISKLSSNYVLSPLDICEFNIDDFELFLESAKNTLSSRLNFSYNGSDTECFNFLTTLEYSAKIADFYKDENNAE